MSLDNPLLQCHNILHQISVHSDLSVCCQKVLTTQCKIDIEIISEDGKIIQTSMKHFLLLLLRNAAKHNSIKFSEARPHVSSDKFGNCMKHLKCNNVKSYCLLVNKRTLFSTKLKKNIRKSFYRLKMQRIPKGISEINTSFTLHEMHVACRILLHHHWIHFFFQPPIFFNHPTSTKWFVSWTVGNILLKSLCGKMLDWLHFGWEK